MPDALEAAVRRWIAESELVQTVAAIRRDGGIAFALGEAPLRPLFKPEIVQLESLGNTAEDWTRVQVDREFNPRRVRNCEFRGDVVLGRFKQRVRLADGVEVVAGLSNSTLVDCVIGHDSVVKDVRLLANVVVAAGAVVADCGRVTCGPGVAFGNGARVPVALEGGGRDVEVFAEMDVATAATVARPGDRRPELDGYRRAVADYRARVTADRGVIGSGAQVWSVPRVEDCYIGPAARIDGAAALRGSTLLSSPDEPVLVADGAVIVDSLVQWGCRVTGMAVVERSLLLEQARVERHGKVLNSVVGPNSEVAAGEVASSLLGPFVGCHHQSLLISTLWPEGRGNVGYGANVGSNHTSRAPDQEFWAGEGLFLGLGVNVKFPCDFSRAPYTVVACGTDLPPQKVTFPFSLIAPRQDYFPGVPPTFNQISPGWMLRENVYALLRNEAKFKARNRATRNHFDFRVLRRATIEPVIAAIRCLVEIPSERGSVYTEREIPGLGKNVMTERDRLRALDAYQFYIRYYALLGLADRMRNAVAAGEDTAALLDTASPDTEWEFQRGLLVQDGIASAAAGLALLPTMALQVARDCERAREKDDTRGVRIIDDYSDVHPTAERDRVVRQAWADADRVRADVERILQPRTRATEPHPHRPVASEPMQRTRV